MHNPAVMIVTEDVLLARSLQVALGERAGLHSVKLMKEACTFVTEHQHVRAIVVDGAGSSWSLAAIRALRAVAPLTPMLFVAAELDGSLLNDLQVERIQVVARPLPLDVLRVFLNRSLAAGQVRTSTLNAWVDHYAAELRLSPSEVALMPVVLDMEEPASACTRLGIEQPELDERLRRIVKKCRVRNTDWLARNLMRDAFLSRSDLTSPLIDDAGSSD